MNRILDWFVNYTTEDGYNTDVDKSILCIGIYIILKMWSFYYNFSQLKIVMSIFLVLASVFFIVGIYDCIKNIVFVSPLITSDFSKVNWGENNMYRGMYGFITYHFLKNHYDIQKMYILAIMGIFNVVMINLSKHPIDYLLIPVFLTGIVLCLFKYYLKGILFMFVLKYNAYVDPDGKKIDKSIIVMRLSGMDPNDDSDSDDF